MGVSRPLTPSCLRKTGRFRDPGGELVLKASRGERSRSLEIEHPQGLELGLVGIQCMNNAGPAHGLLNKIVLAMKLSRPLQPS